MSIFFFYRAESESWTNVFVYSSNYKSSTKFIVLIVKIIGPFYFSDFPGLISTAAWGLDSLFCMLVFFFWKRKWPYMYMCPIRWPLNSRVITVCCRILQVNNIKLFLIVVLCHPDTWSIITIVVSTLVSSLLNSDLTLGFINYSSFDFFSYSNIWFVSCTTREKKKSPRQNDYLKWNDAQKKWPRCNQREMHDADESELLNIENKKKTKILLVRRSKGPCAESTLLCMYINNWPRW
jgi:hypothetical protein